MNIPILVILISLSNVVIASEQSDDLVYWKKLLHFGESQSRVVSQQFFLSKEGSHNYLSEMNKMIELLNSPDGQHVACEFPARYQWLVQTGKTALRFDLKKCPELNRFKQNLQKQTISLVFASEYLDNPVSSFGHTLLVFHDKEKPLLSADVIHFAARTDEQDGFIKYTWKGLTGGYPGSFLRDPFFKKQLQYSIIEQRFIHLYTLNLDDKQIEKIVHHLFELSKATFNYYFINENCAFQIGNLLDIASDNINFPDAGFVLPIEVIKKHKANYSSYQVIHPTLLTVKYLVYRMSNAERAQFDAVLIGKLVPDNSLTNRVKQTLAIYYEYDFKKNDLVNPNYTKVMQLKYQATKPDIPSPKPMDKQDASRVAISYLKQTPQESMLIAYRPFLQDLNDIQLSHQNEFELSLFNPVIQFKNDATSLYRFDLLSIKSLSPRSQYFKPVSWQFYTGLNRQNPAEDLNYEAEFGLGLTYKLGYLNMNFALNIGADISEADYYYKPNVSLLLNMNEHVKFGLNASEKYYQESKYIERAAFISYGFEHNSLNLQYKTKSTSSDEVLEATFFHYF